MIAVEVEMLAWTGGAIRVVDVPATEEEWAKQTLISKLEATFYYGQNDFQPKPFPSVSPGDVVRLDGRRWRVDGIGWSELVDDREEKLL